MLENPGSEMARRMNSLQAYMGDLALEKKSENGWMMPRIYMGV